MKFTAYYFNHNDTTCHTCTITAASRYDAITVFEELYPQRMLVSIK